MTASRPRGSDGSVLEGGDARSLSAAGRFRADMTDGSREALGRSPRDRQLPQCTNSRVYRRLPSRYLKRGIKSAYYPVAKAKQAFATKPLGQEEPMLGETTWSDVRITELNRLWRGAFHGRNRPKACHLEKRRCGQGTSPPASGAAIPDPVAISRTEISGWTHRAACDRAVIAASPARHAGIGRSTPPSSDGSSFGPQPRCKNECRNQPGPTQRWSHLLLAARRTRFPAVPVL